MIPKGLFPTRPLQAHKGDEGHVLIVAGSLGLSGAAYLCSMGCIRSGAGLVTLALPESVWDVMAIKLAEVMTKPLPETKDSSISLQALPMMLSLIEKTDVLAIGPGLSQNDQTKQMVRQLIPKITKPCVIDADALNAIADEPAVLSKASGTFILTPHPGEMARLIRMSREEIQRDRERIAKEFAKKFGVTVVLKGHHTVVADAGGELYVNETGNPGMASGGMGDALTGIIAGLLAQGLGHFNAATLGVYLHGLAGDLAAQEKGTVGLIASDVIDKIPKAIFQYQSGS